MLWLKEYFFISVTITFFLMNAWNVLGVILVLAGVVGGLGYLGEVNPISFISDPLFGLTRLFLTELASLIFWIVVVILGLSVATPRGGYIKTIVRRR